MVKYNDNLIELIKSISIHLQIVWEGCFTYTLAQGFACIFNLFYVNNLNPAMPMA